MKQVALRTVHVLGSLLPVSVLHLIVKGLLQNEKLSRRYGFSYLSTLAVRFNIVRLTARGDYGMFSSSPSDGEVFREYAETGKWSPESNFRIRRFFQESTGTYIDIGANIGLTLVPIAAATRVKCFAFEPEPANFLNLKLNVSENCRAGNVHLYQLALFDRNTTLPFELAVGNLGDHRLRVPTDAVARQAETQRRTIEVPCVRLDELSLPIEGPLLVKIDTQGAEPFVFAGGAETLSKAQVILLEWCPYLMRRLGGDPEVIINFLLQNFSVGTIDQPDDPGTRKQSMKDVCQTLRQLVVAWRDDPKRYVDIFAEK